MKILCVGYSVTELSGYADLCAEHYNTRDTGITVQKSGWGGHTIDTVAYFMDELLTTFECDCVLLELFTSHIYTLGPDKVRFYLDNILTSLAKKEKRIAFLHLYDGSVDYATDYISDIIAEYSARYAIPNIDLAHDIANMDEATKARYFWDNVHNTKEGAELYSAQIIRFIDGDLFSGAYISSFLARKLLLRSLNLENILGSAPHHVLSRNGAPWKFYEIGEGESLTLTPPEPMRIAGLMLAYAPDSGPVDIVTDQAPEPKRTVPHDVWSYYIRSGFFEVEARAEKFIILTQTAIIPDCEPLKGEKSFAARTGRISHLFYHVDAEQGVVAKLLRSARSLFYSRRARRPHNH